MYVCIYVCMYNVNVCMYIKKKNYNVNVCT